MDTSLPAADRHRRLCRRVLGGILGAGLALTLADAVQRLSWRYRHVIPESFRPVLCVNYEESAMTWLTVLVSTGVAVAATVAWRRGRCRGWLGLAVLFAYLSLDDHCRLHERIGWQVEGETGRAAIHTWLIALGPPFALAGALVVASLWRELGAERAIRRRVVLAFGLFALALALEAGEVPLDAGDLRWRGLRLTDYTILVEELAELSGSALALASALHAALIGAARKRFARNAPFGGAPRALRPAA